MTDLKAQLESLIEKESIAHAMEQVRGILSEKDKMMWRGPLALSHKAGANLLLPMVLKLVKEVSKKRCKTYIGIATPGREVRVHSPECTKCKTLTYLTALLEGR